MQAKVSSKGWIVIPSKLRSKYGIKPGMKVSIVDYGGVLSIVPVSEDVIHEARGSLKGEASLTDALLDERRKDRRREARKVSGIRED